MCAQRHRLRRSPGAWCSALASLVLAMPVRSNPIAPHPLSYFGTKDRMIVLLLNVTHSHVRPAASATPLSRGMVLRSRFARARNARSEQSHCSSPAELLRHKGQDDRSIIERDTFTCAPSGIGYAALPGHGAPLSLCSCSQCPFGAIPLLLTRSATSAQRTG